MSRSQDTVIDDDEETCPLCIEEFDLSDKNFRPCPCGYQICQFCYNSLKTTYDKTTCPNCRRPYDEATIEYKIPTAEEFKLDLMNKNKKQAAAKRKENEKREIESSARRNLAGVRVKQQNLVYVIGLEPTKKDETVLLETLRGKDFFGQYGDIEKIVVSKAKPGATNQGIGVYVTFKRKEDAATCIDTVDGSLNGDRVLRAQYGTTKYCSAFLRGETCMNKNCSFLHETGEDGHHTSLQNEPSESRHPPRPVLQAQPSTASRLPGLTQLATSSQPMARQGSKDTDDSKKGSHDGSALPPTAGWANVSAPAARVRRASQVASRGTPSPQLSHVALSSQKSEPKKSIEAPSITQSSTTSSKSGSASGSKAPSSTNTISPAPPTTRAVSSFDAIFDGIKKSLTGDCVSFIYDDSFLPEEERARIADMPPFYDPFGGAKRRIMEDREAAERARMESDAKAKLEAQATSAAEEALDEDQMAAGSLALGGEPEENPRSTSARGAIQRPGQSGATNTQDHFASMRSQTPQQSNSGPIQRAPGLPQPPVQNTAFEMSDFDRRGPHYSQAQYEQISNHQRNGSRYFNNETKTGVTSSSHGSNRFGQQQQPFYSSGVQGPPPGLPTAGTPPVSGGGMFAHGQGFTNTGFGTTKDSVNNDILRGRSGTNDIPKRELLLSLQNNPLGSPPLQASAPGVLNPLYAQYSGSYQDPGLVKQRKKGKKQRHANTSSSGGGVEQLADPTILQARIHSGGATGQSLFGGGNQVDDNFPPLPIRSDTQSTELHPRVSSLQGTHGAGLRSSTPKIPPGFEHVHAHSGIALNESVSGRSTPTRVQSLTAPVVPAVPLNLPQRTVSLKQKAEQLPAELEAEIPAPVVGQEDTLVEPGKHDTAVERESRKNKSPKKKQTRDTQVQEPIVGDNLEDASKAETGVVALPANYDNELGNARQTLGLIDAPSSIKAIEAVEATGTSVSTKTTNVVANASLIASPDTTPSEPPTPTTVTTDTAKSSTARPRTIRLTTSMIQKAEAAASASPVTEKSATLPAVSLFKQDRSRQPSLSSVSPSRPSTPAVSDRLVSRDVSRAGSPPPGGIVGSAPSRVKSKNQTKKDRKEKAKKAEGTENETAATSTASAVEPVGPIIARQKKQKKKSSSVVDPAAKIKDTKVDNHKNSVSTANDASKRSQSPERSVSGEYAQDDPQPTLKEADLLVTQNPLSPSMPKRSYTVKDLCGEASQTPDDPSAIQKLLGANVTPITKLMNELLASGDLNRDHPWLSSPSFNSAAYKLPTDNRKGQDYLDGNGYTAGDAFGNVYLPQKEKRALYAGHAVSVADTGERKNELLRRCLITPNGWVMRHLSAEESERVLELEERRSLYAEEFGDLGIMNGLNVLEDDDFINLGGGIEELGRFGERHGVCWVVSDDQPGSHGDGDNDVDDEDEDDDEGGEPYDDLDDDDDLLGHDGLSEETDDDLGLELRGAGTTAGGGAKLTTAGGATHAAMPGAWDPAFNASASRDIGPNTLPPIQGGSSTTANMAAHASRLAKMINLRAMDPETLQGRIREKQKEADVARKEADKTDKQLARKNREFVRWRENMLKAA